MGRYHQTIFVAGNEFIYFIAGIACFHNFKRQNRMGRGNVDDGIDVYLGGTIVFIRISELFIANRVVACE